jgi:hypothetical protein
MAALYHERDVRYFYFVDEHLLPYGEDEALGLLKSWGQGLSRRGVGKIGIGCMLRADRLTPAVACAFAELGLVRAFIGIELAGAPEDRSFHRSPPRARDLALLEAFGRRGVATVSNLMLVHPESSPHSIEAGIDLLGSISTGVFEATKMMPYHGTELARSLSENGRLLGNPLRYSYAYRSPQAERFAELFLSLRGQAFFDYSLAYRTHDVFLAVALHERVHGRFIRPAERQRLERLRCNLNALQTRTFREALRLSLREGCEQEAAQLVAVTRKSALALSQELSAIEARLGEHLGQPLGLMSPLRHVAASAVGFCLAGTLAAGCGEAEKTSTFTSSDATTVTDTLDSTDSDTQEDTLCQSEASMRERLEKELPCFSGLVHIGEDRVPSPSVEQWVWGPGGFWKECLDSTAGSTLADQAKQILSEPRVCSNVEPFFVQDVGVESALKEMVPKAEPCQELLDQFGKSGFIIVFDPEGVVTQVQAQDESQESQEAAQCLAEVLVGLTFPCLANFRICPEYIIAE